MPATMQSIPSGKTPVSIGPYPEEPYQEELDPYPELDPVFSIHDL